MASRQNKLLSEMSTQMQKYRPAYLNKQIYKPEHQFVLSCGVSPSIDDFEVSKLDKVCMFGISHSHYCMNFFNQFLFLFVLLNKKIQFGSFIFQELSSKCMYHLASRVLPARFWIIINLIPIFDLEIHLYSYLMQNIYMILEKTTMH